MKEIKRRSTMDAIDIVENIILAILIAGISVCVGIAVGKYQIKKELQIEVDQHFMNKKFASTYRAQIKIEYFDGKLQSLELEPGTTFYANPK